MKSKLLESLEYVFNLVGAQCLWEEVQEGYHPTILSKMKLSLKPILGV
jgi:hypothetical protein